MASVKENFIPTKIHKKFIRPLNKGVRNDLPSTQMPDGSFTEIDGYIPQPYGLRRRPTTARYGGWEVDFPPIQGVWTVRAVSGASFSVLMDRRKIYIIEANSISAIDWTYSGGTVSVASGGTTVTGSGVAWKTEGNWILAGDRIAITGLTGPHEETDEDGSAITTFLIESVTDDTTLELETAAGSLASGATYTIYRSVGASTIAVPISVNDTLYFADGQRPIQTVSPNPNTWELLSTAAADRYCPYTIAYFKDRLWIGDIYDPYDKLGGGESLRYRQRIQWSSIGLGNLDTFDPTNDFLHLPYGFGGLRRLMPLSQYLVAYFTDMIWLGQLSNDPDLPVTFTKFETGGMGVVTPKAVTPFYDGHFFIGQDDVYFLSARGVEPVGTAVVKDMLKTVTSDATVEAVTDFSTSTVIFGIATSGNQINELWRFNWKTKGWSKEDRECDFLSTDTILATITWDTLDDNINPDNWSGFTTYHMNTWESIVTEFAWNQQLFFSAGRKLYYYLDDDGTEDADTGKEPEGEIVTGDLDMGVPDTNKVWTKFSLELESPTAATDDTLILRVFGSVDKGKNWKSLGTLRIPAEQDEDAINFRLMGPTARFKLVAGEGTGAAMATKSYTLGGFGLSFKVLGDEVQGRSDG